MDIVSIANKNLNSFKESQEKVDDENHIRYDGIFTVESILERYFGHGRLAMEARLAMLNIERNLGENPTIEELKNHIMILHEGTDIAEGIY